MYLFVYGSLLTNLPNHKLLKYGNARLLGIYKTQDPFYMIGLKSGAYPYLLDEPVHPNCKESTIIGELYEVSEHLLEKLDSFEGHPHHYTRQSIIVNNGNIFEPIVAYTYMVTNEFMKAEISAAFETRFVPIPSGDWKKFYSNS